MMTRQGKTVPCLLVVIYVPTYRYIYLHCLNSKYLLFLNLQSELIEVMLN